MDSVYASASINYLDGEQFLPIRIDALNGRAVDGLNWQVNGFELRRHISAVTDWHDEEALAGGYVKAVLPADKLLEEAYQLAGRIARHSPVAIALTRQMMYRNAAQPHPVEAHKVDSLAIFYASQKSGKEGVASFLEKRAPVFTDRISSDMPPFCPWWE